jgi:hypothetical protein
LASELLAKSIWLAAIVRFALSVWGGIAIREPFWGL